MFSKVVGYKINAQNSIAFLYTSNEQSERNQEYSTTHNIVKKLKCLGINLMKEVKDLYNENCKSLMKEISEDIRRWKDIPCSWTG
jgi:hypothetical protein